MNPAVYYKLLNIALVEGGGDKITQKKKKTNSNKIEKKEVVIKVRGRNAR
jgi:hypothetical protein